MGESINDLRYASVKPSIKGYSFGLLASSLFGSIFVLRFFPELFKWILLLNILELFRAIFFRKSWSELFGRLKNFLFKSSYRAYPVKYLPSESKYLPIALISMFIGMMPTESFADYQLIDSTSYNREIAQGTIGTSPSDVVNGFCNSCPLEVAVDQIVPSTFTVLWSSTLDRKQPVSWTGPQTWGTALHKLAIDNDLYVIIRPQDATGRNSIEISGAPRNRGAFIAEQPRNASMFGESTTTYTLRAGKNLPENLNEWAARNNMRIAWELDRRPIVDFNADFDGSLIDAIEQVLGAYRARGQMMEVRAVPMANNVIVITNRKGGF